MVVCMLCIYCNKYILVVITINHITVSTYIYIYILVVAILKLLKVYISAFIKSTKMSAMQLRHGSHAGVVIAVDIN